MIQCSLRAREHVRRHAHTSAAESIKISARALEATCIHLCIHRFSRVLIMFIALVVLLSHELNILALATKGLSLSDGETRGSDSVNHFG